MSKMALRLMTKGSISNCGFSAVKCELCVLCNVQFSSVGLLVEEIFICASHLFEL